MKIFVGCSNLAGSLLLAALFRSCAAVAVPVDTLYLSGKEAHVGVFVAAFVKRCSVSQHLEEREADRKLTYLLTTGNQLIYSCRVY